MICKRRRCRASNGSIVMLASTDVPLGRIHLFTLARPICSKFASYISSGISSGIKSSSGINAIYKVRPQSSATGLSFHRKRRISSRD